MKRKTLTRLLLAGAGITPPILRMRQISQQQTKETLTVDHINCTEAQIARHIREGDFDRAGEEMELLKDLRADLEELTEIA